MRKLIKWVIVVIVLGELYARGGREFLLGEERQQPWGVATEDSFDTWVDLPRGWEPPDASPVGCAILNGSGEEIGKVTAFDPLFEGQDLAGYPAIIPRVRVCAERAMLGYPINVAIAQVADFTRRTLV